GPSWPRAYAPGGSRARRREWLGGDPRHAAALLEKVARAVQAAHEAGIVHRDLKPSNILLDERDEPLVGDFGLAKLLDGNADLTMTGAVVGTPAYMAPEQAAGKGRDATPQAAVWALAVILYGLLTATRPLADANPKDRPKRLP